MPSTGKLLNPEDGVPALLREGFKEDQYPSPEKQAELGKQLGWSNQSVRNWFRDERGKAREQGHLSPHRSSPKRNGRTLLPTPVSMSPSNLSPTTSSSFHRFPPSFDHGPSRYLSQLNTPYSPYRPGEYARSEYGRSERGLASESSKVERKLFDEDDDLPIAKERQQSSLAPAFEAKMVLRNGASVDLISWLRTNFHHIPEPHSVVTPTMSLIAVRRLLLERFPRVPESEELSRAVLVAFPRSSWDFPNSTSLEPPMIRGLVWHGKDTRDDIVSKPMLNTSSSRSPPQSTLVSPTSSSRRVLPGTPARSVLDEFAEIAALTEKTPLGKARPLPDAPAPAYALATICNSFDAQRKRRASASPERTRASTPDRLHDLLAAAEAVEGSPIGSLLVKNGHKRRRTIGGGASAREIMTVNSRRLSRTTLTPVRQLSQLHEDVEDMLVPVDEESDTSLRIEEDAASMVIPQASQPWSMHRAPASSASGSGSSVSQSLPIAGPSRYPSTNRDPINRKGNELPTNGENPGVDCKPPHPYHEMIRHAIESAPDRKLQLSQIYSSIADRFPFFKTLDEKKTSGWQNSIRHNLSLKKMFVRVNKVDGVPDDTGGKGGWWTVQPGVPDEGRPGRKAKAKKAKDGQDIEGSVDGSETFSNDFGRNDVPSYDTEFHPPAWNAVGQTNALRMDGRGMAGTVNGNGPVKKIRELDGLGFSTRAWREPTQ